MVRIEYYFSDADDYSNYPRFRTTEITIISAKMQRILPATDEIDDKFLPVFIFEKVAERATKRGYVNVKKRYHAYFNSNANGEKVKIKRETYKTYITFIKALEHELIKTRRTENPYTLRLYQPSYEQFTVTLYELFFKDETDRIKSVIRRNTERECEDARQEVLNIENKIYKAKYKIAHLRREIERLHANPLPFLSIELSNSIARVEQDIAKAQKKLGNLKELRKSYYAILKEHKKLSAKRSDTCHTILYALDERYRALVAQEQSLRELADKLVKRSKIRIQNMQKEREDMIAVLKRDIAEYEKELKGKEREYQEMYDKKYREISEQIRKSIV